MYERRIIERFEDPKFSGEIENADAVGEIGNPRCGDIMRIYLKIEEDKIKDIKFKTYGCVAAIASTDFLCELCLGKKIEEAEKITYEDIVKVMGNVPEIKLHCSMLAIQALKKAIENHKK